MVNSHAIQTSKLKSLGDVKVNIWAILLFVFLASSLDFFYLIDTSSLNLYGISINDVILALSFVLLIYVYATKRRLGEYHFERFSIVYFAALLIIVITSSYAAGLNWQQPLLYGIRAQRAFLTSFFLFTTYLILYKEGYVSKECIVKVVYSVAITELVLVYLQWIFGENHIFLTIINTVEIRYGTLRIRANPDLICLCTFLSWSTIMNKKNVLKHFLFVVFAIGFVALISKSRMRTVCLLFILVFASLFIAKISITKKILIFIAIILLLIPFCFTSIGQDILSTIMNGENDTSLIRDNGRDFYLETFRNNPLFAGGYVNIDWEPSVVGSRYDQNIFVVDNGIFGFIFTYGLFGLIYIIILYFDLLFTGIKYYKEKRDFGLLAFELFNLVGLITLFAIGMTPSMSLSILLILHCIQKQELKENSRGIYDYCTLSL